MAPTAGASSDASSDASEDDATVSFLERDLARVARVDWFTGAPFLETEVTHAVALVAPWDALKAFAYKAKLTPGAQKKGKAAKQALEVVTRAPPAADVMRCAKTETKPKTVDGDVSNVSNIEDVSRPKDKEKEKESLREKAARAERDATRAPRTRSKRIRLPIACFRKTSPRLPAAVDSRRARLAATPSTTPKSRRRRLRCAPRGAGARRRSRATRVSRKRLNTRTKQYD